MLTQTQASEMWEYLQNIPVAMMATQDEGKIRARPMHNVQKEFSGKLWFFTDVTAAKTEEIATSQQVCLSYEDTHKQLYISVSGTANTIRDPTLINELWNPMVAAWFAEGKNDPRIALVEVDVHQAEVWDAKRNRVNQLFKMAIANIRHERPDLGEHRQYPSH